MNSCFLAPEFKPQSAQNEVLWRGYVRYGDDRQFPVWAKVRITATIDTSGGCCRNSRRASRFKPIRSVSKACEDSPLDETLARSLDEVVGYFSKSSLRAGSPIRKTQIERPPDVARGDLVVVQVFAGGAYLKLEGRAESAGVNGIDHPGAQSLERQGFSCAGDREGSGEVRSSMRCGASINLRW